MKNVRQLRSLHLAGALPAHLPIIENKNSSSDPAHMHGFVWRAEGRDTCILSYR